MIIKTEKEFVCDRLPTENCHASTVLPLENGNVLCAWFGGTKEGSKDVDIWYTIRNKNGFTDPVRITADTGVPHWNPVLFRNNNGSIVLFFKVGNRIPRWKTYCCISEDGGLTFSNPVELVKGDRSGGRGPVKNKCIITDSGRILAPASTEHSGWICFVDISDDDGTTWRKSRRIKTEYTTPVLNSFNGFSKNKIPMIQPTLWESSPDYIHMFTRTAVGKIYRSDSYDDGETWCEAYPTDLPNNNSGIDIVKTENGDLFLVSNPVSENWGERSPLTLQLSHDNGQSFETVLVLEEEKAGSEYSYPAITYLDSCLHITYTYNRTNIVYQKIQIK